MAAVDLCLLGTTVP